MSISAGEQRITDMTQSDYESKILYLDKGVALGSPWASGGPVLPCCKLAFLNNVSKLIAVGVEGSMAVAEFTSTKSNHAIIQITKPKITISNICSSRALYAKLNTIF